MERLLWTLKGNDQDHGDTDHSNYHSGDVNEYAERPMCRKAQIEH